MAEDAGDRSEHATSRRKSEARKKGQIPLSRDVPTAAMLVAGIAGLYVLMGPAMQHMVEMDRRWFNQATDWALIEHLDQEHVRSILLQAGTDIVVFLMPMLVGLAVVGTSAYAVQTGLLWRPDALQFDLTKLSLLSGVQRLFSLRSVVELLKSMLKIVVIAWVGYMAVKHEVLGFPSLVGFELHQMLDMIGWLAFKMAIWIGGVVGVLAAADYAYQRFEWERKLRMSKEEVKEEHRETEGDPRLKSRVRSLQRQMARKRMMAAVPQADVVITNPTHLAVALRYDHQRMDAPVVVAKGAGFVAARIKEIAKEHGVPVVENKIVARSLFKLVEIGDIVPTDLFRAVAEILAFVYRLKGRVLAG
jgi:flagellar biosynthetic protein FlhB